MEHIGEILKQIRTNSAGKNTDTFSSAEAATEPANMADFPECPVCKGARFVYPLLPNGHPDYSRVIPCRCSRQVADKRNSSLGSLSHFTFSRLESHGTSSNPADQEQFYQAYQAALAFADNPNGWLVFSGPSGCGKTHLAVAIANRCIENGLPVFYISTPDLLDHLRSAFGPASESSYDEMFEQVRDAPFLILDDLGAQSSTPWAKEKLEQLLSHRFSSQLATVVVSIIPLDDLDERLRTRLAASEHHQLCPFDEKSPSVYSLNWPPQFNKQKQMTFDSFDWKRDNLPLEQRENLDRAYHLAQEFAKSPEGWLVFQGNNGCGKTHLAAAIVNYRYAQKKPALFVVVPDFLDHLRSSFSPDSKVSYDQLFESVKNAPLLVLDDFGKQSTTPWAQEKLYQVINHRYNAQLPTVITTNSSADEMDGPILSRFADPRISTLFTITAPDYFAGRYIAKKSPPRPRPGR